VIQNWFVLLLPVIFCKKEGSPIATLIRASAFCRSPFTIDTIKACASCTWFLFMLQGIFAEDEQHPCPAISTAGEGSWPATWMPPQQQPAWLSHRLTVPAIAVEKLIPSIISKMQATIFLCDEFITVKKEILILSR